MSAASPARSASLPALVEGMLASYRRDPRAQHVNRRFLPSRDEILEIVKLLMTAYRSAETGRTLPFPAPGMDRYLPRVAKGTWRP